ncbi:MAG: hypothetical protein NTV63_02690 [Candidatus Woesearchaeota archaeon]|nr:hypothetical protein [Candidatus Woesearchaeota archaeon]
MRNGKILQKKGEGTSDFYLTMFYVICFAGMFLLSLRYTKSVTSENAFEKIYITRDLALIMGTIQASPGELKYNYPTELGQFKFTAVLGEKNSSIIDSFGAKNSYPYACQENISDEKKTFENKIAVENNGTNLLKIN